MKNDTDRVIMGLGGVDTLLEKRTCTADSCDGAATTTLDHYPLCLNHFLLCCYERLEELDPRGRQFSDGRVDVISMRAFIEECSRKALDISLQSESLSKWRIQHTVCSRGQF